MPTVVNVRDNCTKDVLYIGRAIGSRFQQSMWANPFIIGRDGDRDEVIAKYRAHLLASRALLAKLPSLAGKQLGCWCVPQACHGNVLVELFGTRVLGLASSPSEKPIVVRKMSQFCCDVTDQQRGGGGGGGGGEEAKGDRLCG